MPGWETLNCANHSDRIAIERCEVCNKPLCAYCLYYSEDGQRLCAEHADLARMAGLKVEEPGAYADQLLGAQAGVFRKQKRGAWIDDESLYKGNSHDLVGFLGAIIGLVSVVSCCGAVYCLPIAAFALSLAGIINAKNAFDPKRTRKLAIIGLLVSGVWVVILAACIAFYGISIRQAFSTYQNPNWWQQLQPSPLPTDTPTWTPTFTPDPNDQTTDASVWLSTPAQ
jgi:hypothetical protein